MKVAIVVPAHNEEENIEKLVNDIDEVLRQLKIQNQIIIVDDNSNDNTTTVLKKLSQKMTNLTPVFRSLDSLSQC